MGMRGPGSERRRQAAEDADENVSFPWMEPGMTRVERVIAFLEYLPITKGIMVGQKMKLLPEQIEFLQKIYGQIDSDGHRVIRIAVQSEPKGNGKTGLTAGICLCHLVGPEAEPRGEVYSAAVDRDQAAIVFEEMAATLWEVPELAVSVNIVAGRKRIYVLAGPGEGSKYESLSSDARGAHGRAPSLWVYDELAQAKDRRMLDNLMQGMSKREDALGIVLSTQAEDDAHPLSELIDMGLSGVDPTLYVQLICAPEESDPFSEETLRSCNPAWGSFLNEKDLMQQAARAKLLPSMQPGFKNLRLNQRVHATNEDILLTKQLWMVNAHVKPLFKKGATCYGGLDLSGKQDLSALVLVFPGEQEEPDWKIKCYFWTPEGQLEERKPIEQELFKRWIQQKYIEAIPGKIIRYRVIAKKLIELREKYDLVGVAFDRWRIDDLKVELSDLGMSDEEIDNFLIPFGQGYKDMSPAVEMLQELAISEKLFHGGHPVLTACVSNSRLTKDPAGNMKIDKSKTPFGSIRIDGAVAMTMALGYGTRAEEERYVEGGIVAVS